MNSQHHLLWEICCLLAKSYNIILHITGVPAADWRFSFVWNNSLRYSISCFRSWNARSLHVAWFMHVLRGGFIELKMFLKSATEETVINQFCNCVQMQNYLFLARGLKRQCSIIFVLLWKLYEKKCLKRNTEMCIRIPHCESWRKFILYKW